MKLVMLTRYDQLGASSRLRMFQFRPALEAAGFDVDIEPLFSDAYLKALYAKASTTTLTMRAMMARASILPRLKSADVIWLEKEALPWLPWALERALIPRGVPVVADYDDSIFHNYDLHSKPLVRRVLGQKIDHVMRAADTVIAGNAYLAERAHSAGAARIEIVPTVVDANAYSTHRRPEDDGKLRVGWIGSPSTWNGFMEPMLDIFMPALNAHDALFRAVGTGQTTPRDGLECLPWSEDSEIALIQSMDIGVMPLDDSPWARGKCGYKLIQYMACGLPVIASPVGVNSDIVEHGVNGFLADTPEEWRAAIETLLGDPALRARMGAAGRAKFEAAYSTQSQTPRLIDLLKEAAARGARP